MVFAKGSNLRGESRDLLGDKSLSKISEFDTVEDTRNSFFEGLKMKRLGVHEPQNEATILDLSTTTFRQKLEQLSQDSNNLNPLEDATFSKSREQTNSRTLERVTFTASDITDFYISSGAMSQLKFEDLKLLTNALVEDEIHRTILLDDLKLREEDPMFLLPIIKLTELSLKNPSVFANIVTSGVLNTLHSPKFESLEKVG